VESLRVAPVGLFLHKYPEEAMDHGMKIAALTHGHPTGYISAGAFAVIVAELINGKTLTESLDSSFEMLRQFSE